MKKSSLDFKKLNTLTGWILFLLASLVYVLTSEPTTSFWDCGEYIATAYKLQVGHPPGAPLFQLMGRFFSLFAFGDTSQVARMINAMSALSSGLTIAFLFWSITMLAKKIVAATGELTQPRILTILGSGIAGALAYTFSDSFWFSAVEGEVYAMSSLFTAMTFWAILKWETVAHEHHAYRWIILIALLIGLSIGVHLLNLLAIPAVALVYYFRNRPNPSWKGIILLLLLSFVIVAVILYGIIPEIAMLFANTELLFVNTLGLPFNSGTVFFALVLVSVVVSGIMYTLKTEKVWQQVALALSAVLILLFMLETRSAGDFFIRLLAVSAFVTLFYYWRKRKELINVILLSFTFILIGYSSFFLLIIRSNANTPINENSPKNAISLLAYLNREQYGSTPLFYGNYYNAPVIGREDGKPVYARDDGKGKYVIRDDRKGTIPVYDPGYMTLFPRMWNSQDQGYIENYKRWAGITNDPENKKLPTFGQNLRFFFRYQVGNMYFRYLFWNFVGRQNDRQNDYGDVLNGNWISGINFLDEARLGPQQRPESMQSPSRNTFYFLPLLFGILGLYYHFKKNEKDALVVLLLFIMTGLAIVVYLNQQSPQPRERDYAYAASFYAFTIWIGLSVAAVTAYLQKKLPPRWSAILATSGVILLVPVIMAAQGWKDHDRSGRYTALEVAKAYLDSCAPNAVLFTNGDNDTFPLWYAQEVEGYRTDVRVCNLSLFNTDWYIEQMLRKAYDSEPLPLTLPVELYRNGSHDYTVLYEQENIKDHVEVAELFSIIKNDDKRLQINTEMGPIDYFPTRKFRITVDPEDVIRSGTVGPEQAGMITDLEWTINRSGLTKAYLMMMDLLAHNNWERPVYYVTTTGSESYLGLEDYFRLEGLAYRLVPVRYGRTTDRQSKGIDLDVMYDNLMNKFEFNVNDPGIYINEDNYRMISTFRSSYSRLAGALMDDNRLDSAVRVCDRIMEMIPDRVEPLSYYNITIGEVYYSAGEIEKGRAIFDRLLEIQSEQLDYFFSFPPDFRPALQFNIEQNLAIIHSMTRSAERLGQEELREQIQGVMDIYYGLYVGNQYNP